MMWKKESTRLVRNIKYLWIPRLYISNGKEFCPVASYVVEDAYAWTDDKNRNKDNLENDTDNDDEDAVDIDKRDRVGMELDEVNQNNIMMPYHHFLKCI